MAHGASKVRLATFRIRRKYQKGKYQNGKYQKAGVTAFWYALDQNSAKQPSEKAADSATNHGSHWAECGPERGTGRGTTGNFVEMSHRAANLVEFFVGEQHWRCNRLVCRVHHWFVPRFALAPVVIDWHTLYAGGVMNRLCHGAHSREKPGDSAQTSSTGPWLRCSPPVMGRDAIAFTDRQTFRNRVANTIGRLLARP
jgi:hypothetical protein